MNRVKIKIGDLFKALNFDNTKYDETQSFDKNIYIKDQNGNLTNIIGFVKKDKLEMITVKTEKGKEVTCSKKHKFKIRDFDVFAEDAEQVETIDGIENIISKKDSGVDYAYDITVSQPHYYQDYYGFIHHNTSCAKIIAKTITEDIFYLNASERRGIDTSREIIDFCEMSAWDESRLKIVILDEFDNMTDDAQKSLKNTIEEFSETVRFILTCNNLPKVNEAIESRCTVYTFSQTPKKEIARRCADILKKENIKPVNFQRDIKLLINEYYPDIRSIVGSLQEFSSNGIFKVDKSLISGEYVSQLLEYIKKGQWSEIQSKLCGTVPFENLFSCIFENAGNINKEFEVDIMMCVAEGLKTDAVVADRQVNFISTVLQVMRIIEVV